MHDKGMWKILFVQGKVTTVWLENKVRMKNGKKWGWSDRLKTGHKLRGPAKDFEFCSQGYEETLEDFGIGWWYDQIL